MLLRAYQADLNSLFGSTALLRLLPWGKLYKRKKKKGPPECALRLLLGSSGHSDQCTMGRTPAGHVATADLAAAAAAAVQATKATRPISVDRKQTPGVQAGA
jgi:hypothetical protein